MDEEEEQLSRRRGILMRTQHVIALSGPPTLASPRRGIYCVLCSGVGNYAALLLLLFLRQTAIPLAVETDPKPRQREESSLSRAHKKPQLLDLCPKKGS